MAEIPQVTQKLISHYKLWHKSLQPKEGFPLIHVDEVVSRVAVFYEKMRGVIDWREEHLLRKTAVERVLKRRLFLKRTGKEIAEPLVHELIRGGHFPNDAIPESKIQEIQQSIDKYVYIMDNTPPAGPGKRMKSQLYDWLLGIAACEVEEILAPPIRETAIMDFMLERMSERIEVKANTIISRSMPADEKDTQIYIAIQKALFKLDPPIINYNLLKKWHPDWTNLPQDKLEQTAKDIYSVCEKLEKNLKHSLGEKFYAICERYDTAYLILGDIMAAEPAEIENILKNPEVLENRIRAAYKERLKKAKGRLRRAAFYSTLSIFLSKMLVAFAVEVPFDKYISGAFNPQNAGLSVVIPSLIMTFLVLSIRSPSKQNEQLVVMEVMKITYEKDKKEAYNIKPSPKRGIILNSIIGFIYLLSFVASFGLITWGLAELNFSFISIIIFLAFISLISFAGIKIRQRAQELKIEKEKDTLLRTIIDIFSLPVIQVGNWLSGQWQKHNAVAVLLNSLTDMPFQVFLEFLEQWRLFLREKKEKIH